MKFSPFRLPALLVAALLVAGPAAATPADEAVALLATLAVKLNGQPVTTETLSKVQSVGFGKMKGEEIAGAHIALLAQMPNLYSVDIYGAKNLTPEDLVPLTKLAKLGNVTMSSCNLGDAHAAVLADLKTATWLRVSGNEFTDAATPALAKIATLTLLDLGSNPIGDAGLAPLGRLPALATLHLNFTKVTGPGLADLATATKLQELGLQSAPLIPGVAGAAIARNKSLKRLYPWYTPIDDRDIAEIGKLAGLETLYLNNTATTDAAGPSLAKLSALRWLWLNHTKTTDAIVEKIAGLPLENVQVDETGVTDRAMPILAAIPTLRNISARKTGVTDAGVAAAMAVTGRHKDLRISK
ncbi:MAG: hypothetical protein LWW93_15415 [Hyphomicrobiales bacterium]|nr:hypothetical protein [Hyphomicrobiales bacterium]